MISNEDFKKFLKDTRQIIEQIVDRYDLSDTIKGLQELVDDETWYIFPTGCTSKNAHRFYSYILGLTQENIDMSDISIGSYSDESSMFNDIIIESLIRLYNSSICHDIPKLSVLIIKIKEDFSRCNRNMRYNKICNYASCSCEAMFMDN